MFCPQVVTSCPALSWNALSSVVQPYGYFLFGFAEDAIVLSEQQLEAHTYIVGDSNSGKTSRVIAPLLEQLITARKTVWVVDCKADPMLLGHLRAAASAAGRPFHFFSLQPGVPSTCRLDFFEPLRNAKRTPAQIAEVLLGSLALHQAREPFFVTQNSSALRAAIATAMGKGRLSFKSIAHELRGLIANSRYEHAGHALDTIEGLAACPELNDSKLPVLELETLLRDGSVCYFCLPVSTESKVTAATTASLLLKLTTLLSKDLAIRKQPCQRIYFAIDEFQDVAGTADLKDLMAQVRGVGSGISLILAHQVAQQVSDEGMRALLDSAGVLVFLRPRACARKLQEWSGEKTEYLATYSRSYSSSSNGSSTTRGVTYTPRVVPALDMNDIQWVSGAEGFAIAVIGGRRPFILFFPHHVDYAVARQRAESAFALPPPKAPRAALRPTAAPKMPKVQKAVPKPQAQPVQKPKVVRQGIADRLAVLAAKLRQSTLYRRQP